MNEPEFASYIPKNYPCSVSNAISYDCDGPYKTKIGAELYVGWVLPKESSPNSEDRNSTALPTGMTLEKFLRTDPSEIKMLMDYVRESHPNFDLDFSGDRLYFQPKMPVSNNPAGNEFHRIRREIIIPLSGKLQVELEDVYGTKRNEDLTCGRGLVIPPFIVHTFYIEEPSSVLFRANTLFMVNQGKERIAIPDTYSREIFEKLRANFNS